MSKRKAKVAAIAAEKRQRTELISRLTEAVQEGHLEKFKEIVNRCSVENGKREKLLNFLSHTFGTFLHIAAERNRILIVNWLLSAEQGEGRSSGFSRPHYCICLKGTALHVAIRNGNVECFHAIVNGCTVDNGEREWILNAVDCNKHTVLHLAAECGQVPIVSWLLSEDGGRAAGFYCVLARNRHGETVLHIAARNRNFECFLAIVNGLRVDNGERRAMMNAVDRKGKTILHIAVFHNCEEIINWILSDDGGQAAGFNSLLAKTTEDQLSALHFAAQQSSSDTVGGLLSHCTNEERMNLFLAVDKHGWTALHLAARRNRADIISNLLSYPEHRFIVNRKDNRGMTVLHRAIIGGIDEESRKEWGWYFKPNNEIIRVLLGLDDTATTTTTTTTTTTIAKAWIDPNIGLGLQ